MQKVYLTEHDRLCARLAKWVYGEMKAQRITQEKLAGKMNIRQQSLNRKLKEASFDYEDFVFFVKEFRPDTKTLCYQIGYE